MVLAFVSMPNLSSVNKSDNDTILITPPPAGGPNGPRSSLYNPFAAYHTTGYVIITSEDNTYGEVCIQIENPDFSISETLFDTSDGIVYCPIVESAGYYHISIITEQGYVFTGDFYI